jgi:hypothetical protein
MDPELDDDAQAMAQAMGFSSFGAQDRPQKKRKYNPQADAAGLTSTAPPLKEAATGSNMAPLGTRAPPLPPSQPGVNNNEISLDDEEDDKAADGGAALGLTANQIFGGDGTPGEPQTPAQVQVELQTQTQMQTQPHGLPQRPPPANSHQHPGPSRGGHHHPQGRHQGSTEKHSPWYEGYYDPSTNENPWQRLEDSLGLQPKGPWVPRGAHPVPTR